MKRRVYAAKVAPGQLRCAFVLGAHVVAVKELPLVTQTDKMRARVELNRWGVWAMVPWTQIMKPDFSKPVVWAFVCDPAPNWDLKDTTNLTEYSEEVFSANFVRS